MGKQTANRGQTGKSIQKLRVHGQYGQNLPQSKYGKSICHGQNKYSAKFCWHLKLYCLVALALSSRIQPAHELYYGEPTSTILSASCIQKPKFSLHVWNPALHSWNSINFSMLRTTGAGSPEYDACRTRSASSSSCTHLSSKVACLFRQDYSHK